ncbi:MAG: BatD family protein [Phycisphaerales bacterium]|nr:BatD family protein [Phycisphaerales bacterium]
MSVPVIRSQRWFLVGLATLVAAPIVSRAAEVELRLGSRQAFVNEPFLVQVEVSNFQAADAPVWMPLDGARVRQLGAASESTYVQIINNRRTESRSRTYHYELTPLRAGELLIPPVSVNVDGRTLRTQEVRLQVRSSDVDEYFAATITLDRARLYVGQRARATLTAWIRPPVVNGRRVSPNEMWARLLNNTPDFGPFPREVANPQSYMRTRPGRDADAAWYALEMVAEIVAERPGLLTFGDLQLGIEYPTSAGRRLFRVRPTDPGIEVLPLPTEGRPAGFSGAVGLFHLETHASPTTVRVGDPIELVIDVFGDGPIETLPPPDLAANAALVDGFRLPDGALAGQAQDGRRRFAVTIRARREDVTEIPPIEYPYFDPDAERFVVARSKPIRIDVSPAAEIETPGLGRLGASGVGTVATPVQMLDGLRDIETREAMLLASPVGPSVALVAGIVVVPPLAFGSAWAAMALRRALAADPARRRRAAALGVARRRLAEAATQPAPEAASAVAAALSGYVADRLDQPPARVAGLAGAELLRARGLSERVAQEWEQLAARCDEIAFAGGSSADGRALVTQAESLLRELEHETR